MLALVQGLMSTGGAAVFPILEGINNTLFGADTTAHAANYPATVAAGDLIVFLVTARVAAGDLNITTPSGLTLVDARDSGNNVPTPVAIYSLVAAGTEGGTTVNFVTNLAAHMAVQCWRFRAGTYSGGVSSANNIGTASLTVTCPTLSFGSTRNAFVIQGFGSNGTAGPSAWALPDNQTTAASGGTNVCRFIASSTTLTASSIGANSYTMGTNTNSAQFTLGIFGP